MQQLTVLQLTKCNINHKDYYTATTIRVNYSFNFSKIIRKCQILTVQFQLQGALTGSIIIV